MLMDVKGGFHQCVSFISKNGTQTFDEIGDEVRTAVVTKEGKYKKATVRKLDKKKQIYKVTFRKGVYVSTDTAIYAAADQEWYVAGREGKVETTDLEPGDVLVGEEGVLFPWAVVGVEYTGEEHEVWSVKVDRSDSFCLRNKIATASISVGK